MNRFYAKSHELHTPLGSILTQLEKIAASDDVPAALKRSLSTACKDASNLMNLVVQWVDVDKSDVATPALRAHVDECVQFISEVARSFSDVGGKKNFPPAADPSAREILSREVPASRELTARDALPAPESPEATERIYFIPSVVTDNPADRKFLQDVTGYIHQNLRNPQLSVESIAELFSISRSQVYRKMKALTGQTVVEVIRSVRLGYALELMAGHKYNLAEVADLAGFNSQSYFTRSFKDQYGKVPSEYLEMSRAK